MANKPIEILLVGKTGNGKSSTGNTIIGERAFRTEAGESVTKTCRREGATFGDQRVSVIDSPGFCNTNDVDVAKKIDKYLLANSEGIDVIALVLSAASRPTQEEISVIEALQKKFGPGMKQHLFIIVTRVDDLRDTSVQEFVHSFKEKSDDILNQCCMENMMIGFNNETREGGQAEFFLEKVRALVTRNEGALYTTSMLKQQNFKEWMKAVVKKTGIFLAVAGIVTRMAVGNAMASSPGNTARNLWRALTEFVVHPKVRTFGTAVALAVAALAAEDTVDPRRRFLGRLFLRIRQEYVDRAT